jgi:hypothetical protein
MSIGLGQFVEDFARGIEIADGRSPQAINLRSKVGFQVGLGPHSESATVKLVMAELKELAPERYPNVKLGVPYGDGSRQKCDLALGAGSPWDWLIEVKMLRMLGDNAKQNDNLLTHIISPYAAHRSALTDCYKLASSALDGHKAIVMYGYDAEAWPMEPLVRAFETLAHPMVGSRETALFDGLVHPVHSQGSVFAWEINKDTQDPVTPSPAEVHPS